MTDRPMTHRHRQPPEPRGSRPVAPPPLGACWTGSSTVFRVFSRSARRAWVLLFDRRDADQPVREIPLERAGDLWQAEVSDAGPGLYYAYRMDGPCESGHHFDPDQWLIDPYALEVAFPRRWGDSRGLEPGHPPKRGAAFPKSVILDPSYDWSGDVRPDTPLRDSVIYELHVRGYTAHPSSGAEAGGTYRGLTEKIPYLESLGVTAVELLPVHEFDEMEFYLENKSRRALRNFWGYSTLAFFAPQSRYASSDEPGAALREFREMVAAFHRAGMEVILDVVYNHTAELDGRGPVTSFRGLDNPVYYQIEPRTMKYRNFTGCGNTVNTNHPVVRDLIVDSLRYWVEHVRVDGFRFDLASILCRGRDGKILENPPIVERIGEDPVLSRAKLIAEAWDAAGLYQVGSFPHPRWSEWNGRYRDDVRAFWNGEEPLLGALATRLAGSADLYGKPGQTPQKSINFITCHDGFTLRDLVSYREKHNEANGEQNADGEKDNRSANYGAEGPTDDPAIRALRLRQQKNMLATLLVSQGVPMLLGGDEFGRTQEGNNNAYCQDNEISWVDWSLQKDYEELADFTRALIAFRKAHPSLRYARFLRGGREECGRPDIEWFGPNSGPVDWDGGRALSFLLHGHRCEGKTAPGDAHVFIALNGTREETVFRLPAIDGADWSPAWDTTPDGLRESGDGTLHIPGLTVAAWTSGNGVDA
jgi:isoamylase